MAAPVQNLTRSTLQKAVTSGKLSPVQQELAQLRIDYSIYSKLLTGYVNQLVNVNRVYPRHLPTQASFRWSTFDPPITNWPRACINPVCPQTEHEWIFDTCWSVRDILLADTDEVLISWDHDNIEGRIHDLIVDDAVAIKAHQEGQDLHTITCCNIFGYALPKNLTNPHTSLEDTEWRSTYNWQGKDTKPRVLAKNFNHGSKYTETWKFVYKIQGIEKYGVSYDQLGTLARAYITSKAEAWQAKLLIMASIKRKRRACTLYGGRRIFYDSSPETGREGFSHMISGTVSDYNNMTLQILHRELGHDNVRLLHNAHDGDKVAVKRQYIESWFSDMAEFKSSLSPLIERPITYEGRSLVLTAGIKVTA